MLNGKYNEFRRVCYYKDDNFHREDGPAVEFDSGTKIWYKEGKIHRLEGPAIYYNDGFKQWWIEGKKIECSSQKEFERMINLINFW